MKYNFQTKPTIFNADGEYTFVGWTLGAVVFGLVLTVLSLLGFTFGVVSQVVSGVLWILSMQFGVWFAPKPIKKIEEKVFDFPSVEVPPIEDLRDWLADEEQNVNTFLSTYSEWEQEVDELVVEDEGVFNDFVANTQEMMRRMPEPLKHCSSWLLSTRGNLDVFTTGNTFELLTEDPGPDFAEGPRASGSEARDWKHSTPKTKRRKKPFLVPRNEFLSYGDDVDRYPHPAVFSAEKGGIVRDPSFVVRNGRVINEWNVANLPREEFMSLPEVAIPDVFPWMDVWSGDEELADQLWSSDGSPMFSNDLSDDDHLDAVIWMNKGDMFRVMELDVDDTQVLEGRAETLCTVKKKGQRCLRMKKCKCGLCPYHCPHSTSDDLDPFSPRSWRYLYRAWPQLPMKRFPREGMYRLEDYDATPSGEAQLGMNVRSEPAVHFVRGDSEHPVRVDPVTVEHLVQLPVVNQLISVLQERNDRVDWKSVAVEAAFAGGHIYFGGLSLGNIALTVTHFLKAVGLPSHLQTEVQEILDRKSNAEGLDEGISAGMTALCVALVALATTAMPKEQMVNTLFMRFSRIGQMMNTTEKIATLVEPHVEGILDFFRSALFGYTKSELNGWKEIDEWVEKVQALQTSELEMKVKTDPTLGPTIDNLIVQGNAIVKQLDLLKIPLPARTRVRDAMMAALSIQKRVANSSIGLRSQRAAPAVIHFYGDTGVGKTTTLNILNNHLLVDMGCTDPRDIHNKVYYREPGQDFWDGFVPGTKIIVYDDIGTMRDSVANPDKSWPENIRAANTAPWVLSMADLADKGNTLCEPEVVEWTSNQPCYTFASITNPEAVMNRVSLKYRQRVKPEFGVEKTIGGVKYVSLNRELFPPDRIAFTDFAVFDRMNPHSVSEEVVQADMTFDQVVEQVLAVVRKNRVIGKTVNANNEEHFKMLVAKTRPTGEVQGASFSTPACAVDASTPTTSGYPTKTNAERAFEAQVNAANAAQVATAREDLISALHDLDGTLPVHYDHRVHYHEKDGWLGFWNPFRTSMAHVNVFKTVLSNPPSTVQSFDKIPRVEERSELFEVECLKCKQVDSVAVARIVSEAYHYAKMEPRSRQHLAFTLALDALRRAKIEVEPCLDHVTQPSAAFCNRLKKEFPQATVWSHMKPVICDAFEVFYKTFGVAVIACGLVYVFEFLRKRWNKDNAEAYNNGPYAAAPRAFTLAVNAEGTVDPNAESVSARVVQNLYTIWFKLESGGSAHAGNMLVVTGRCGLMNSHVWHALPDEFVVMSPLSPEEIKIYKSKCTMVEQRADEVMKQDVVLVELPIYFRLHSNIVNQFMTLEDYSYHRQLSNCMLLGFDTSGVLTKQFSKDCVATDSFNLRTKDGKSAVIRSLYRYSAQTRKGDCGSVLLSYDPNTPRKIVGIHCAGETGPVYTGACCAVAQETVKMFLQRIASGHPESILDGAITVDHEAIPSGEAMAGEGPVEAVKTHLPAGIVPVGKVQRIHAPTKTKIRKSPVHGIVAEPTTAPAQLRRDDQFDPMQIALKKLATPSVSIDQFKLDAAVEDVKQLYGNNVRVDYQRVLTFEEAIAGVEGDAALPPINRRSSPGYGWKKDGKGKTLFLGEDEYIFDHPEVLKRTSEMIELCKQGKRPGCVWTDTLKDETRPFSKINQGKTRLFSAGEMASLILMRQYFDGFCAHVNVNKIQNESAVGINVYGPEWAQAARWLSSVGKKVVAGDFTNYDGLTPAEILWRVLDVIESFYSNATDEDRAIRRSLWMEIVNSVHVNGDVLYVLNHSNPSGCPFTTILNTVGHSIMTRVAFLICGERAGVDVTMDDWRKSVRLLSFGDDDVVNFSDDICEWFNQETMTEAYKEIGMVYTDEAKSGATVKWRKLSEVSFLKRKFRYDRGFVYAPLSLDTILEMCNWIKGRDEWFLTAETLKAAIYELSLHDKATWDVIRPRFDAAIRMVQPHYPFTLSTYDGYHITDLIRHYRLNPVVPQSVKMNVMRAVPTMRAQAGEESVDVAEDIVPSKSDPLVADFNKAQIDDDRARDYARTRMNELRETIDHIFQDLDSRMFTFGPNVVRPQFTINTSYPSLYSILSDVAAKSYYDRYDELQMPRGDAQSDEYAVDAVADSTRTGNPPLLRPGEVTEVEITKFEEDADVLVAPIAQVQVPRPLTLDGQDILENSVKGFLGRRIRMLDVVWKATDAVQQQIGVLNLPRDWYNKQMIMEKLQGFRYLKCDLVFELQVNAQAFNAGMLLLWEEPLAEQLQYSPSSTQHLGGMTGYRKVIYNIEDGTAAKLAIRYNNILTHFDLVTQYGTMGRIHLNVLSKLTGATDADVTLWCWAENIDIQMPTGMPLTNAQAGDEPIDNPPTTTQKRGRNSGLNETKQTPGPITNIARSLSGVAASLKNIPVVSSFAATANTVFDAVGSITSMFGWSKPTDETTPQLVTQTQARHMANYNGDSKPKVFALDAKISTNIPTFVFGTDEDEMAIQNVISRPVYHGRFSIDATDPQEKILNVIPVNPSYCDTARSAQGTVVYNTFLSYVALMFKYWRGSIEYHFKFVKTRFHSLRVAFIWVPGATPTTDFKKVDFTKCYMEVHDIRNTNSVDFCVPFTFNQLWADREEATGVVVVQLVNSLRAPETCAQNIEVLTFTNGGPDMQFAFPEISKDYYPILGAIPPPNAQSAYESVDVPEFEANKFAVGEAVVSFRQLCKRYHPYVKFVSSYQSISHDVVFDRTGGIVSGRDSNDFLGLIGALYRFKSGALRVLAIYDGKTPGQIFTYTITLGRDVPETNVPPSNDLVLTPFIVNASTTEPLVEMQLPFYQQWPAIPTNIGAPVLSGGPPGTGFRYGPANPGTDLIPLKDDKSIQFYRAIGEDFAFGYLIGPPATFFESSKAGFMDRIFG